MRKYSLHEIDTFFNRSNLSFRGLEQILDIPEYRIKKYLIGDGSVSTEDSLKIDTAIRVINEMSLRKPEWNIGKARQGKIRWDVIDIWNNEVKGLVQKRFNETLVNACQIIVFIIGDRTGHDEFHEVDDPLANGGLSRYGKDEFLRHMMKTMVNAELYY